MVRETGIATQSNKNGCAKERMRLLIGFREYADTRQFGAWWHEV